MGGIIERGWGEVDWIHLAEDRDQWRVITERGWGKWTGFIWLRIRISGGLL
jgi:hypothetical protein